MVLKKIWDVQLTIRMENFESTEEPDANRQAWERGLATLANVVK